MNKEDKEFGLENKNPSRLKKTIVTGLENVEKKNVCSGQMSKIKGYSAKPRGGENVPPAPEEGPDIEI